MGNVCQLLLLEFAVVCAYKHSEGELFMMSLLGKPSKADYAIGPLIKCIYYVLSQVTYASFTKNPTELGPHVQASAVCFNYLKCMAIMTSTSGA